MRVLGLQTSHLLLIRINLGYTAVLTAACARQGRSASGLVCYWFGFLYSRKTQLGSHPVFLMQEVELDMIVRRSWVEDRIQFTVPIQSNVKYVLDPSDAEKFWNPEFYIQDMVDLNTKHGGMDLSFFMVSEDKRVIHAFR
jgi:hypothetical protein